METTNQGSSAPIYLFLVVMLALMASLAAPALIKAVPLSNHAETGHAAEAWNASKIQDHMLAGKCSPKGYVCKKLDTRIQYCEIGKGRAIGLVIGLTVEKVLTGFEGSVGYWKNRCN